MKIYMVTEWDGEYDTTLKLFMNEDRAQAFRNKLQEDENRSFEEYKKTRPYVSLNCKQEYTVQVWEVEE